MQGKRIFPALVALSGLLTVGVTVANAQTSQPQFLMTWAATNSYTPPGYQGKVMPTQGSTIQVSLELIVNGKPVNLSGQTVYWYANDAYVGGGVGVQHFNFHPTASAPAVVALKVELPYYPTGAQIHEIDVPIVQPMAVIEASYPKNDVPASPAVLQAIPYFFATSSTSPLSFAWSVNGQTVTSAENPETLQISLPASTPAGYNLSVSLTIQNSQDSTSATDNATLMYQ